jgi:predicted HicB family RNase H-like nuclease
MSKAHVSWGTWVSSDESNRRAGGRRRWLGVRRLRAKVRRHELIRLCATEGLHYGCRSRWARRLGVSPATITADFAVILRQHPLERYGIVSAAPTLEDNRHRGRKRKAMSTRVTVRLSPDVHGELKRRARQQGQSLAAFIRQSLKHVTTSTEPSAAPPGDIWKMLLASCPGEVQAAVRRVIDRTGLPVADVLRSFVIAAATGAAGAPQRPSASLDAPASSRVSGERTGTEDSV